MIRILVRSLALASAVHGVAWACSCVPDVRTAEEHLAQDEIVVWGTVVAIPEDEPADDGRGCGGGAALPEIGPGSSLRYDVRIEVVEGFIGAETGEVITIQASQGSSCAVVVQDGERWLVMLGPDETLNTCNPSRLAEDGDPMLESLRTAYAAP